MQRAQRIVLESTKEAREFDVILQNTKNVNVRTCAVTSACTTVQDIHPSSALHMGRNVVNMAKPTISRWSADPCVENWVNGRPKR